MTLIGKIRRFRVGTGILFAGLGLIVSCRQQSSTPPDIRRDDAVRAVEQVMPSVVNIATATILTPYDVMIRQITGLSSPASGALLGAGSGVIIDEEGHVLTSLHVLQSVSRVAVKLWDGREFDCDGVASAIYSDMALIKIRAPAGEKFHPIRFAPSDDVLLGETVIAVGNPLGLGGSVTKGILSSKVRRLPTGQGPLNFRDWLQTDAAINEGNSGGPLINLRGEMIGLNEAVVTNQQNIGFAIPIKQVQAAVSQFFRPEAMNAICFGARVTPVHGSLYVDFLPVGGPAESAGLRLGDEIVQVNGQTPHDPIEFNRALCGIAKNTSLSANIIVRRQGERFTAKVQMISFDDLFRSKLGFTMVRGEGGLEVKAIEPNGPAAQLREGFLLAGIDGQQTPDLMKAVDVLSAKKSGEHVLLNLVVRVAEGNSVQIQRGTVDVTVR